MKNKKNNLETIRSILDITAEELADLLNCSTQTIYAVQSGRQTFDELKKIKLAKFMNCDESDFEDPKFSKQKFLQKIELRKSEKHNELLNDNKLKYADEETGEVCDEEGNQLLTIPVLNIEAACGFHIESWNGDEIMRIDTQHFTSLTGIKVSKQDAVDGRFIIIRARGDSMHPTISDGSLCCVDRSAGKMPTGDLFGIYLFKDEAGGFFIKQINSEPRGLISILSHNKARTQYKSKTINEILEIYGTVDIIGSIVWHTSKTDALKEANEF